MMPDEQEREVAEIREVLACHAGLAAEATAAVPVLWPDYDLDWLAGQWQSIGFSAVGVERWLSARAFSPWAAWELGSAHLTPEVAAQPTDLGDGPPDTIAFKCSTRQLSIVDAVVAVGIGVVVLDEPSERRLIERSDDLADARRRAVSALDDLEEIAQAGPVYPSSAGDTVYDALSLTERLAGVVSALAANTYRSLGHAMFHDQLDRTESAAAPAVSLAELLDAFSADLRRLNSEHYRVIGGGTLSPSHFGLRLVRQDGRDPDLRYDDRAR